MIARSDPSTNTRLQLLELARAPGRRSKLLARREAAALRETSTRC